MLTSIPVPILLVDDRRENLLALSALLEGLEHLNIVTSSSGEAALYELLQQDFALILMDVQMPGMDGFEAAALIRANPKTHHVPIIFVTALHAGSAWEFRGYESGAVDYLVKPLEPLILKAKVRVFVELYQQQHALAEYRRYMEQAENLIKERTGRAGALDEQVRVLLVDDRPENLVALEALLDDITDLLLVKVQSGPDALRAVLHDDFAAILLDVQMPGMDGYETAELIRGNVKTRQIPIIFVTAGMKDSKALSYGYQHGAVDYLIKPLEPAIVKSKVQVFCNLYRQRKELEHHGLYLEVLVAERTAELQHSATELARTGENHRQLAEKLELATRAAGIGVWDWNVVSNELVWDTRMYELYGVLPEQFGGAYETWLAGVHPDDRAKCDAAVQSALRQETSYDIEFRICRPDGSLAFIKGDGRVVFDAEGRPLRMTGVNYDITERKSNEQKILSHRNQLLELVNERTLSLRAIVDHAADGIITIDDQGLVLSFNAAAERMFGYKADAVVGRNVRMLMPESYRSTHDASLRRYCETLEAHVIGSGRELEGRRFDGSVFPLYIAISEMMVAGERRFTGILRDISAQKSLESSLIKAREVAESANRAKSVFLSNMSHELRTPLNAVIGFSRLMAHDESLNDNQRRNLDIINRAGNHLLTVINDVLDMSKIEAGRMQLFEEATNLGRMLQELTDLFRVSSGQAGLHLQLETTGLPRGVKVDAVKLRQVLINLLGNAIKFTEQGSVRLVVTAEPVSAHTFTVLFAVSDTGMGIAADAFEQIFEPFAQLNSSAAAAGTGLGLTLSRQYVRLLGGELKVDSTWGKGSSFHFSLTLMEAEMAEVSAVSASPPLMLPEAQRGKRIFVADADSDSQILLCQLLESLGFHVRLASTTEQLLPQILGFGPELLILGDAGFEDNGWHSITLIRERIPALRTLLLTAHTMATITTSVQMGVDAFLVKPIDELKLYAELERLLAVQIQQQPESSAVLCSSPAALSRLDLQILSPERRNALRNAAGELNRVKLTSVLSSIRLELPQLAAQIQIMIDEFRYYELWFLLEEEPVT